MKKTIELDMLVAWCYVALLVVMTSTVQLGQIGFVSGAIYLLSVAVFVFVLAITLSQSAGKTSRKRTVVKYGVCMAVLTEKLCHTLVAIVMAYSEALEKDSADKFWQGIDTAGGMTAFVTLLLLIATIVCMVLELRYINPHELPLGDPAQVIHPAIAWITLAAGIYHAVLALVPLNAPYSLWNFVSSDKSFVVAIVLTAISLAICILAVAIRKSPKILIPLRSVLLIGITAYSSFFLFRGVESDLKPIPLWTMEGLYGFLVVLIACAVIEAIYSIKAKASQMKKTVSI